MMSLLPYGFHAIIAFLLVIAFDVLRQMLPRKKSEPPIVFHWVPFIGNAIAYGKDPYDFLISCQKKVCWLQPGIL